MELVQNSSVSTSEYRDLPLSELQESPTNPRRRYNETALKELADSFRSQGVLEPLLVRPVAPERYEIVAGSRRYRAAGIAELDAVPVRIKEMTDAQAIEAQCIENMHREDVHPLEEATAFAQMLAQGYDIATLAARIGKPATFVANRVQLIQLIPPIAEAFLEDKLSVGHATLIAKLPAAQQPEAFTAAFRSVWTTGGQTSVLVPIRELAAWIENNILLDLRTASFDRSDATLIPEAGSCNDCPKRTGFNTLLFSEFQQDNCLSRECFQAKIDRHIARSLEHKPDLIQISTSWNGNRNGGPLGRGHYTEIEEPKRGRNGKKPLSPAQKKCSHATSAIVVDGGNRGQTLTVCADPTCTVHHAENQKARAAQDKMRQEQRDQTEKRKLELTVRRRVLAGILSQGPVK
ncbi:MAG TPA: ParB/RepB/Spo0J family partition protein [Bryobacteraceae bacterium]|nr:ParB/RepB/Spo0J family partition protein [Bryobacteraceae bacterium]